MSRNVDPSEFLLELGFGGPSTSILARIPARFFTKSHVRDIFTSCDTQLPGKLFSPSDISKKTVPPLFIAFSNWYGFL